MTGETTLHVLMLCTGTMGSQQVSVVILLTSFLFLFFFFSFFFSLGDGKVLVKRKNTLRVENVGWLLF